MTYTKQTWTNGSIGGTPLSAARLQHIEDGLEAAAAAADEGGSGDVAGDTHAATSKTTPVDADEFPIVNSAASNALGKVTFANLKTWIKAYLDSLSTTFTNKTMALGSNTITGSVSDFNTALTGADFYTSGGSDVALADGGTGASLTDPNADRIMFWDDSAGSIAFLAPGTNLSITGTTIDASGGGGSGIHRASTNVCVAIGDSITAIGTLPAIGDMYMSQICMKTKQRVQFGGTFALGGTHLQVLRDTYLPMVLAMNPLPGACIVFGGTNDTANTGGTWSLSGRAAILKDIVASLVGAGVLPILVCIPPHTDNTAFNPRVIAWNTWIRRYASRNGYPVLDAYTALADATGNYITGFSTDGLHPTAAGHKAIADRALADGLAEAFPAQPGILTRRSTADLTTLFNNGTINLGMFTTNSSGLGTGLSLIPGGDSVQSIVDPEPEDDLLGKWQQIARETGDTGDMFVFNAMSTGWSAGDVIAFSARIQTEGCLESETPWSVCLQNDDGEVGLSGWNSDLDGLLYVECTLPVANSLLWFKIAVAAVGGTGTPKVRVGEVSIVNLTTQGLLV